MSEIRPDVASGQFPPHLGPAIPELSSIWFKMYLYHVTRNGPPSLLLPKGSRPCRLPKVFNRCSKLLVTSWGNEPSIIPAGGALSMLLDALQHSSVLVQAYTTEGMNTDDDNHRSRKNIPFEHPQVEHIQGGPSSKKSQRLTSVVPFPMKTNTEANQDDKILAKKHPCLASLTSAIDIEHSCGYITLINLQGLNVPPSVTSNENLEIQNKHLAKEPPKNGKMNKENAEAWRILGQLF